MANIKARVERPLSPHLQIYRPMLTMMMSIVHRITGGALLCRNAPLACGGCSPPSPARTPTGTCSRSWASIIGQLVLFGYTWALIHHTLGGIRHLVWDTGHGFGAQEREWFAVANLVGSIGLTILLWVGRLFRRRRSAMSGEPAY